MQAVSSLGLGQIPQTQSNIDRQIQELKANPRGNGSVGLIHFAEAWFGLQALPDEVKWQLFHAAKAYSDESGIIHVGGEFGIDHLTNPNHLAKLYQVLKAYYNQETRQKDFSIFFEHLEVMENYFQHILQTNITKAQDLLSAFRNLNDTHNLSEFIAKFERELAERQRPTPAPIQQPAAPLASQIAAAQNVDPTYFAARVPYPQTTGENAQSWAQVVAYAHTGILEHVLGIVEERFTIDQFSHRDPTLYDINRQIEDLTQKRATAADILPEDQRAARMDDVQKRIRLLEQGFIVRDVGRKGCPQSRERRHEWDCNRCRKLDDLDAKSTTELANLRQEEQKLSLMTDVARAAIDQQIATLHQAREEKVRPFVQEFQANLANSRKVMDIILGRQTGTLQPGDAHAVIEFIYSYYIAKSLDEFGVFPYGWNNNSRVREAYEDSQREGIEFMQKLRNAIDNPNWRVIRIEGRNNWVYIRNPDGSIDQIQDQTITRRVFENNQGLFLALSNYQNWQFNNYMFYPAVRP